MDYGRSGSHDPASLMAAAFQCRALGGRHSTRDVV